MTLLITIFSAVISTLIWYNSSKARKIKVGILCYSFWGASLMWIVDAVFEYAELKADFFTPSFQSMLNDTYLGLSVVALALIVWVIVILIKDPDNILKEKYQKLQKDYSVKTTSRLER